MNLPDYSPASVEKTRTLVRAFRQAVGRTDTV
jgi:hypothetical protein